MMVKLWGVAAFILGAVSSVAAQDHSITVDPIQCIDLPAKVKWSIPTDPDESYRIVVRQEGADIVNYGSLTITVNDEDINYEEPTGALFETNHLTVSARYVVELQRSQIPRYSLFSLLSAYDTVASASFTLSDHSNLDCKSKYDANYNWAHQFPVRYHGGLAILGAHYDFIFDSIELVTPAIAVKLDAHPAKSGDTRTTTFSVSLQASNDKPLVVRALIKGMSPKLMHGEKDFGYCPYQIKFAPGAVFAKYSFTKAAHDSTDIEVRADIFSNFNEGDMEISLEDPNGFCSLGLVSTLWGTLGGESLMDRHASQLISFIFDRYLRGTAGFIAQDPCFQNTVFVRPLTENGALPAFTFELLAKYDRQKLGAEVELYLPSLKSLFDEHEKFDALIDIQAESKSHLRLLTSYTAVERAMNSAELKKVMNSISPVTDYLGSFITRITSMMGSDPEAQMFRQVGLFVTDGRNPFWTFNCVEQSDGGFFGFLNVKRKLWVKMFGKCTALDVHRVRMVDSAVISQRCAMNNIALEEQALLKGETLTAAERLIIEEALKDVKDELPANILIELNSNAQSYKSSRLHHKKKNPFRDPAQMLILENMLGPLLSQAPLSPPPARPVHRHIKPEQFTFPAKVTDERFAQIGVETFDLPFLRNMELGFKLFTSSEKGWHILSASVVKMALSIINKAVPPTAHGPSFDSALQISTGADGLTLAIVLMSKSLQEWEHEVETIEANPRAPVQKTEFITLDVTFPPNSPLLNAVLRRTGSLDANNNVADVINFDIDEHIVELMSVRINSETVRLKHQGKIRQLLNHLVDGIKEGAATIAQIGTNGFSTMFGTFIDTKLQPFILRPLQVIFSHPCVMESLTIPAIAPETTVHLRMDHQGHLAVSVDLSQLIRKVTAGRYLPSSMSARINMYLEHIGDTASVLKIAVYENRPAEMDDADALPAPTEEQMSQMDLFIGQWGQKPPSPSDVGVLTFLSVIWTSVLDLFTEESVMQSLLYKMFMWGSVTDADIPVDPIDRFELQHASYPWFPNPDQALSPGALNSPPDNITFHHSAPYYHRACSFRQARDYSQWYNVTVAKLLRLPVEKQPPDYEMNLTLMERRLQAAKQRTEFERHYLDLLVKAEEIERLHAQVLATSLEITQQSGDLRESQTVIEALRADFEQTRLQAEKEKNRSMFKRMMNTFSKVFSKEKKVSAKKQLAQKLAALMEGEKGLRQMANELETMVAQKHNAMQRIASDAGALEAELALASATGATGRAL